LSLERSVEFGCNSPEISLACCRPLDWIAVMSRNLFRFEGFTLDLQRLSVQGPLGPVDLRRKSFEVLRYLSENSGRVVTKDEVMQAVWPDVTVGDEALPQCISEIRRAIGDESQRIIKTVPRRGYLLDVPISAGVFAQSSTSMNPASGVEAPALPDRPSIAVLAFTNMNGDPAQEYLSDGITEDIITELSRFSELFVIARNSTFKYKGRAVDVRRIGRELGVRYVLEGSVRREGDRIRISAQLIDAAGGAHRWAERYDRKLEDVFLLQDELAHTIVGVLATHVRKAEVERARVKPPSSWLAHDYYMRAADTLNTYQSVFSRDVLRDARRLLEQALVIDPSYARAHAALSLAYTSFWIHRWDEDCPSHVALERAHQSASAAS
jgi:adenylate cyclase